MYEKYTGYYLNNNNNNNNNNNKTNNNNNLNQIETVPIILGALGSVSDDTLSNQDYIWHKFQKILYSKVRLITFFLFLIIAEQKIKKKKLTQYNV